ncbi:hypothetical protein SUGI_0497020 [Cryptomeria japonica]|nr:hypothetical protein SUGI_0497020 [Cryptomeria japonica]
MRSSSRSSTTSGNSWLNFGGASRTSTAAMDIQSGSNSMGSSSHSSTASGNSRPGEISLTSETARVRNRTQDASFDPTNWVDAQSKSSVSQRAQQTLSLLHEAYRITNRLSQKIQERKWLQINETQCKEFLRLDNLAAALFKFLEGLKNESSEFQAECWTAAQEMYRVIFLTQGFVEDCALPISPVRCLKNVGNGTDFALIQYQLIWSIRLLKVVLCQAKGESDVEFFSHSSDIEHSVPEEVNMYLERYCTTDREELLNKLKQKFKRFVSSFVISQEEGSGIMEQPFSLNCVFVDLSELKFDYAKPRPGRGSYGAVSCATWLGERVAVKNVQANRDVFKQEVNLQAGLRHPHILPLFGYSFNLDNGECYMVMELAKANLRTYISKQGRNLMLESKLDIMLQIAEGMKYLHSKELMHRDLKIENVLIQWKEIPAFQDAQSVHAKLSDFGLARTKFDGDNSLFRTQNVGVGTSFWKAPEVLRESSATDYHEREDFSPKADVYSFSMIFYEVLTGKIPFQDAPPNLLNFRAKVLDGKRPDLHGDYSEYLTCYIKRCWDATPEKRPSFADICNMLRHFKSLLLRIGERPPVDFHIFSIFTAADFESICWHLGMEWCIDSIRAGKISKEVLQCWIMVEKYRLNAKDQEKYNEILLLVAENLANITGSEHDFHRAYNFIQDAAESGHAEAQWRVGLFLELGLGVEKNEKEAIKWYEAAARQNYVCAFVELGRCYKQGRGVEKWHDLSAEYCRKACIDNEGKTVNCIKELLIMLNKAKDPRYSELAAKRLSELTFEEGMPLISGPNLENIQLLVNALGKNVACETGSYIVLILKEMAIETEFKEEIIYSGGIAAIIEHLNLVRENNRWCVNAVETLQILFQDSGTEVIYVSVQKDLIAILDDCLRYNAPCFVDVLIMCLKENVSKLWLRRNTNVISSLMSIHSRAPGVSNDKALEIRKQLEGYGKSQRSFGLNLLRGN